MHISLLLLLPSVVLASFCGQQAVPFTFQALKSGHPVLGCARPRCFGAGTTNGTGEPAQFYRIHGKEDGYMRKSEGGKGGKNEMAACSMSFSSSNCGIGQWVGGVAPQGDVRTKNQLRCCAYGPLLQSEDRGIATVKPGQLVVGGEVILEGRVVAFDYVADLAKTVKEDGSVEYNVALRRMSCFDEPIGSSVQDEIIGQPSDLSLQQVTEKPRPYSPWSNPPVPQRASAPQQPRQIETATEYPGQPLGLQPEPLEGNPAVGRVVTPPTRVVAPSAAPAPQYPQQQLTPLQLQQQQYSAQQTAALAYLNPQMNPMMAQIQQQQQQLAKQQQELIVAQQQLLAAQQSQAVPKTAAGPLGGGPLLTMPNGLGQPNRLGQPNALGQPMALPRLPKLEELPKLNIPSIEQVENAIPPLEKAVLTTVARFFGVL